LGKKLDNADIAVLGLRTRGFDQRQYHDRCGSGDKKEIASAWRQIKAQITKTDSDCDKESSRLLGKLPGTSP